MDQKISTSSKAFLVHSLRLMTFRHEGSGLHSLTRSEIAALILMATAVTTVLPALNPESHAQLHWVVAFTAGALFITRLQLGKAAAACISIVMITCEPFGLALYLFGGLPAGIAGLVLMIWKALANIVFLIRLTRAKRKAQSEEK